MRPDPKAIREAFLFELARLRELGVRTKRIGMPSTRKHIERFASEFVEPERHAAFLSASTMGPVDHAKWLRSDLSRDTPSRGTLDWLMRGASNSTCLRLDRRVGLPAVELKLEKMDESWIASWPGAYVQFVTGRALIITVDYEVFQCDSRAACHSPYR